MAQKDSFSGLSWNDLETWVGNKTLQRGRSYSKRVSHLCRTSMDGLLAWVQGTHRYATHVYFEGDLSSRCSCPVGTNCKHAVAVVVAYLDEIKKSSSIPLADATDTRFNLIEEGFLEDRDEDEFMQTANLEKITKPDAVRQFIEHQPIESLRSMLLELSRSQVAVRQVLEDKVQAHSGADKNLLKQVRQSVEGLARVDWDGDYRGGTPNIDLGRLESRLKLLLEGGYYDELVGLGHTLLKNGKRLVEQSHDEGELSGYLQSCMEIILSALALSTLSKAEQLLWLIEAELDDEYGFVPLDLTNFWEQEPSQGDWGLVAEWLQKQLQTMTGSDSGRSYKRDRISNWLVKALKNAGRKNDILVLLEQEALKTGSYVRFVQALIDTKKLQEADSWIKKGIVATEQKWPGIAQDLRDLWKTLRENEKSWGHLTALSAEDFFISPNLSTFYNLKAAAERSKHWQTLESLARHYLESGKHPGHKDMGLPELDLPPQKEKPYEKAPFVETLLQLAMKEKKSDEVLRWYDYKNKANKTLWRHYGFASSDDSVALSIHHDYPERAIAIWKQLAESAIAQTDVNAYHEATKYLRTIKPLMEKHPDEWSSYVIKLRDDNKKKRKLVEILNSLMGRSILES
jgi:uncharacterized Zn finger protein